MVSLKLCALAVAVVLIDPLVNIPHRGHAQILPGSQQPAPPRRKLLDPNHTRTKTLPGGPLPPYAKEIALQTLYLTEPLGRAHYVLIRGQLGGAGSLSLDGNGCSGFDVFGDPLFCTLAGYVPIAVKIQPVRPLKADSQQRYLFDVVIDPNQGPAPSPSAALTLGQLPFRLILVLGKEATGPHRFAVMNKNGVVVRVIPLEPATREA